MKYLGRPPSIPLPAAVAIPLSATKVGFGPNIRGADGSVPWADAPVEMKLSHRVMSRVVAASEGTSDKIRRKTSYSGGSFLWWESKR
jgi:hypothetical protein